MWLEATLAAAAVIAADQASKALILSRSPAPNAQARVFSIRKVLARRGAPVFVVAAQLGLWAASAGIAMLLLQRGLVPQTAMSAAGVGAAMGGAAGNLTDRLRHGAIVDFIVIGRWPVFNLADVAITCGIGLLLLSLS